MNTTRCLVCDNRNPPGAKFCCECGSSLQLKPCPACDAIDNQTVTHCWKCGAVFDDAAPPAELPERTPNVDQSAGREPEPVWSAEPMFDLQLSDPSHPAPLFADPRFGAPGSAEPHFADPMFADMAGERPLLGEPGFDDLTAEPPVLDAGDAIPDAALPEDDWVDGLPPKLLDEFRGNRPARDDPAMPAGKSLPPPPVGRPQAGAGRAGPRPAVADDTSGRNGRNGLRNVVITILIGSAVGYAAHRYTTPEALQAGRAAVVSGTVSSPAEQTLDPASAPAAQPASEPPAAPGQVPAPAPLPDPAPVPDLAPLPDPAPVPDLAPVESAANPG